MTDKLQSFINASNSTIFGSRDVEIGKKGEVKLGGVLFSAKSSTNFATMKAFREALSKRYGVFGETVFDSTLALRFKAKKSLRACDISKTLSKIDLIKKRAFTNEISRQLDTDPLFRSLPKDVRTQIRGNIKKNPFLNIKMSDFRNQIELYKGVSARIRSEIDTVTENMQLEMKSLGIARGINVDVTDNEPTGLKDLKTILDGKDTSVEDKLKSGKIGIGLRINNSKTNPILLQKIKDNGVEPGFIYKNDWSLKDSISFSKEYDSEKSIQILNRLKAEDPKLEKACANLPIKEQIMLCGYRHPAVMSAIAESVIEIGLQNKKSEIYKAFETNFPLHDPENWREIPQDLLKNRLFIQIRDAVLAVKPGSDLYGMSPVFKKFSDSHIIKLDYNENDRLYKKDLAHAGKFRRPERVAINRKFGKIYRLNVTKKADDISASAVTEALANDISRIMGIPTQELRIVRGKYSDGHPKIMLEAKFANGYKDLESGFIKDGQLVKPKDYPYDLEKLGKYKAFFLVTADRDAIGSRGQNKGLINGKFFAIDPGHSLEGNGKYLEVEDNLSFKVNYGLLKKPRFNNFSVFDDDTRFAKLQGVVNLREIKNSGAIDTLFRQYKEAFNPNENGISKAEAKIRTKIIADIEAKEKEFNYSLQKILNVSDSQLHLYDALSDDGAQIQQNAIETIENLEKLTSPTTWISKNGTVPLEHLQVIPETRVAWNAHVEGDNIVYNCDEPLSEAAKKLLTPIVHSAHGELKIEADGTATIKVSKANRETFFNVLSEKNVMRITHPEESVARESGHDGILEAKNYKSPLVEAPLVNNQKGLNFNIPETLDVMLKGKKVTLRKQHYEAMLKETPLALQPKTINELKAILTARIEKGNKVIQDVLAGKGYQHKTTPRNAANLVLALHAIALTKGEYLERGAFSVADPEGRLYQWLNNSKDIYFRTSTHATAYHHNYIDGHMNMPRGFDIPAGMSGLFGDMKTFQFFAIPELDRPPQPRRLYLKPETHGIYHSTIKEHEIEESRTPGMQTRPTVDGDWKESILHFGSLLTSISRGGEANGNRKETMPKTVLDAVKNAKRDLDAAGLTEYGEQLVKNVTNKNGGIRQLINNIQLIFKQIADKSRADRLDNKEDDDLFAPKKYLNASGPLISVMEKIQDYVEPQRNNDEDPENKDNSRSYNRGGAPLNRIGNEIMLEMQELTL